MSISTDLTYAILAMDAYNRGYEAGLSDTGQTNDPDGLGEVGSIGGVEILNRTTFGVDSNKLDEWKAAGFYAIAYEVDGQTVISYRGTDDFVTDVPNGYWVGASLTMSLSFECPASDTT